MLWFAYSVPVVEVLALVVCSYTHMVLILLLGIGFALVYVALYALIDNGD